MLLLAASIKLVAEIALMAQLGQGLLGLIAGARRHHNPFYRMLGLVCAPFTKTTRWFTPRAIIDRHIPVATFALMLGLWLLATAVKIQGCVQVAMASPLCR